MATARSPVAGYPPELMPFPTAETRSLGRFLRAPRAMIARGEARGLSLPRLARFLLLDRTGYYWSRPAVGTTDLSACREGQLLLWERTDRTYGLLLPLVDGDVRTTLRGDGGGLSMVFEGALPGQEPESAVVAIEASGG